MNGTHLGTQYELLLDKLNKSPLAFFVQIAECI